jgi:hypothetical protein
LVSNIAASKGLGRERVVEGMLEVLHIYGS